MRANRFREFITLPDKLLTQPETNHTERFYSAIGARALPGYIQHRPRAREPFQGDRSVLERIAADVLSPSNAEKR